jgi:hypothetical protein
MSTIDRRAFALSCVAVTVAMCAGASTAKDAYKTANKILVNVTPCPAAAGVFFLNDGVCQTTTVNGKPVSVFFVKSS